MSENNQSIEFNKTNSTLLFIAIVFMIGSIYYSLSSTLNELDEKRARLNAMTIQGVAGYIMEKNPGIIRIDAITKIHPISLHENVLEFPYYVKDSFLRRFASSLQSTEDIKNRLQWDTLNEDCKKTAFSVFLQKGGIMHYTYRLQKDTGSEFLFEFSNTWDQCQE
jgi:hypothetical protein